MFDGDDDDDDDDDDNGCGSLQSHCWPQSLTLRI